MQFTSSLMQFTPDEFGCQRVYGNRLQSAWKGEQPDDQNTRLKLSGKLWKLTDVRPVYKTDTQWLSVYEMFDQYCKLRPILVVSSFAMEQVVMVYLPIAREHADLLALLEPMTKLKSVTLALQRDNITIADVNCLFEKATSEFPCTKKYLDPMAPIVHSPVFEIAVCKLQNGQQSDLTEAEKGDISNLLIQRVSLPEDIRIVNEEEDFASSNIKKRRQKCETNSPDRMYIDTRFLLSTSNILERFFQHCRYHVFWCPTNSTVTKLGNATRPEDKQKVLDTWCSGKVRKFSW